MCNSARLLNSKSDIHQRPVVLNYLILDGKLSVLLWNNIQWWILNWIYEKKSALLGQKHGSILVTCPVAHCHTNGAGCQASVQKCDSSSQCQQNPDFQLVLSWLLKYKNCDDVAFSASVPSGSWSIFKDIGECCVLFWSTSLEDNGLWFFPLEVYLLKE